MAELATKQIYLFDKRGRFIGTDLAVESPAEPGSGNYLLPPNATDVAPPEPISGKERVWTGAQWEYVSVAVLNAQGSDRGLADAHRERRKVLLLMSDYTQLPDAPSWVDVQAWRKYRQQLRDITIQAGFPQSVNWPQIPERLNS